MDYLRGRDDTTGAREAVGGDIVVCKCERLPRILSVYARSSKYIDVERSGSAATTVGEQDRSIAPQQPSKPKHARWLYVTDSVTHEALRHRKFIADVAGTRLTGKTDEQGYAKIESDSEQPVSIHIVFHSPACKLNSSGI